MNIKFNYLYRDAGNYKVFGNEVFTNPDNLTLEEIEQSIREHLIDGEFFDPLQWSLEPLRFEDWDLELDHTWNEFESVEFCVDEEGNRSISELLSRLENLEVSD